jgi:hypothetical protein
MATLQELRKAAKRAGVSAAQVRGAETRDELQTLIDGASNGEKTTQKASAVKKAVASATKKRGRGRPKGSTSKATKSNSNSTEAPKKRGRPAGSKNSAPKKTTTRKTVKASNGNGDGRHMIGKLKKNAEGWAPRKDSFPDLVMRSFFKNKQDRSKVYDEFSKDVWAIIPKKTRGGEKRSIEQARDYLMLRINRVIWQYATQTNQHSAATDRIKYGTGENATVRKAGRKRGRPAKANSAPAKRGRPAKAKASTGKRGRGRPKGSKNKK